MHAQIMFFDGPRSPELVAASDFAATERVLPAVRAVEGLLRFYRCRRADGAEVIVALAETERALLDADKAIMSTRLLPGEDPALLPGPDRLEILPVIAVHQLSGEGAA